MHFSTIAANSSLIVACMAALSVFFASIVVSWPYLVPDRLGARMREIADEREAIRIRERGKLLAGKHSILGAEPKKIFKNIFDRLISPGRPRTAIWCRRCVWPAIAAKVPS